MLARTTARGGRNPVALVRTGGVRATRAHRHTLPLRLIAGAPLLVIGLAHVFAEGLGMRALVEAAGLPMAGLLSPLAVAAEIAAGLSLVLGWWTRVGAVIAVATMAVALYAHFAIDVWPNGEGNEPPPLLPIAVLLCAAYLVWRGAGRWSIDRRSRQWQAPHTTGRQRTA